MPLAVMLVEEPVVMVVLVVGLVQELGIWLVVLKPPVPLKEIMVVQMRAAVLPPPPVVGVVAQARLARMRLKIPRVGMVATVRLLQSPVHL
ncbi:MAG: hypothetical protein Q7K71_04880 [Candidatus Omnitrophota bacterium]|nr:hypothetical protein [Candidatus Omnitrophota bacterium]